MHRNSQLLETNYDVDFKIKGQSHNANAPKSLYLSKYWT